MTIEKWFFLLITTLIAYLFWSIIQPFALVLLSAAVAAVILAPLDDRLNAFIKHPRVSAGIVSFGALMLLVIPMLLLSLLMVRQASDLLGQSLVQAGWIDGIRLYLSPLLGFLPPDVQTFILSYDLSELGTTAAKWSFNNIGELFSSTTNLILNSFLFFVALYYLLVDRERLYKEVLSLSPLKDSVDNKILKRVVATVRSVVFGVLILAVVQGIFATVGMTIFGVPGSLIWGAVTMIAALVPVIGTALVLGPAILFLFFTGSTGAGFGLLIWSIVVVGCADNVLGPYLIKGTTKMHAFLVLLCVLGGIQTFGYIGVIAGPTILAALLALIELYQSGILAKGKTLRD